MKIQVRELRVDALVGQSGGQVKVRASFLDGGNSSTSHKGREVEFVVPGRESPQIHQRLVMTIQERE